MRTILLSSFLLILITSCSKYQYYTLSSDTTPKDEKHHFLAENDTCRISYDFTGANGPITISVYNKTDRPLQIDWKRSALILGDSSVAFFDPQISFNGEIERNRYAINQDITGTVTPPESLDFIPPRSGITKQRKYVRARFTELAGQSQEIRTYRQKLKLQKFTNENSPLVFRIYLTLVSGGNSFYIDNRFFASEIVEARAPLDVPVNTGDRFFIKEKTGSAAVSTILFLTGLTILLVAAF